MDLKKISETLGRGMMRERFGMDWEEKKALLQTQLEQAQFTLQEAKKDAAEVDALVRAGKLPSSNLTAAKFLLEKARQDMAMTLDQAQKAEAEARTGLITKQTGAVASPEEAMAERKAHRGQVEASTRASNASANYQNTMAGTMSDYRKAQAEASRAAAAKMERPVQTTASVTDLAGAMQMAKKNIAPKVYGWLMNRKGTLHEGTPEYQKALEDEAQRILALRTVQPGATGAGAGAAPPDMSNAVPGVSGVKFRRNPATGQTFMNIGGQDYPVSPDLMPGSAPAPGAPPEEDF